MSGRLDGREQRAEAPASPAPERGANGETDPDIPQDPGIPGPKVPDELPPQEEPEVERVPDSDMPDSDDEGHMASRS